MTDFLSLTGKNKKFLLFISPGAGSPYIPFRPFTQFVLIAGALEAVPIASAFQ